MTLRDRIVSLIKLYQFDVSKGVFSRLANDIYENLIEHRGRSKKMMKSTQIGHEKRFIFIQSAQNHLKKHPYYIPPEVSATVLTEITARLRRNTSGFEDFCKELWEISKVNSNEEIFEKKVDSDLIPSDEDNIIQT